MGDHGISLISRGAQLKKKAAEAAEAGQAWTSLALYKSALDCMVSSYVRELGVELYVKSYTSTKC